MQGHVKFDVLNASGTVLATQEKDNVVLPPLTDFLQDLVNLYNTSGGPYQGSVQAIAPKFLGTDNLLAPSTFGLVLFNEAKSAANNGYVSRKVPLAFAGSTVATPTATKGSLVSAVDILNEQGTKRGIRMVWDFAANTANGTIASACLTTREYCDNTVSKRMTQVASNVINFSFGNSDTSKASIPNVCSGYSPSVGAFEGGRRVASILDNSDFAYSQAGAHMVTRSKIKLGATAGPLWTNVTKQLVAASGFSDVFKVVDDADENQYIIFGTAPTGNRAIAYVDKTSLLTTSITEVSCVNGVTIYDWGLCGKFIILSSMNGTLATSIPVLYAVDTVANTYSSIAVPNLPAAGYIYGWNRNILTYRTVEGDYACDYNYLSWYSNNQAYACNRHLELFTSDDGNSIVLNANPLVAAGTDFTALSPMLNFGTRPTCLLNCASYNYTSCYNYLELGFARRTLFSICNLDTPVVKTAGQVLRVTYDLTWA